MRLLFYAYHLFTMALVALAVLTVFYSRGDLLLLSLAIIALVMLSLGAWRYLPRYLMEGRLLLNVGAVRQGERVIYRDLPLRIANLNLYSELSNPELEGVIRLPLSALAQLISRPRASEDWFPCRVGEYLLLPDGAFALVLQQTIERVRLKVMGSTVEYGTAEFLQLAVRNLSREGFGIAVTFGIDYQHQSIALDEVPQLLHKAITDAFANADFDADLKDLLVEFKAANASSLDYLVYASMDGNSAASYFAIGRLIQQTCVDVCNRENWVIPFTQLTVHQAEATPAPQPD
jgi:small-conductance mechanosensitive channel